eukprot:CAMPEP_0202496754 /NCGR_PEP_ID=MMETSP1361-20130828/20851_1 /ASSEMBLY_ACC=CAM_ASM_000849 /TAXON_ID=210615 /ORGANISM="Staurosira complex sp., Strain CCMP2646" /LENGTH=189 /DNA_ID=CAMNT_0049128165 /DNA_START=126 /DNA_END=696 /DNA_ORIENTATION=+
MTFKFHLPLNPSNTPLLPLVRLIMVLTLSFRHSCQFPVASMSRCSVFSPSKNKKNVVSSARLEDTNKESNPTFVSDFEILSSTRSGSTPNCGSVTKLASSWNPSVKDVVGAIVVGGLELKAVSLEHLSEELLAKPWDVETMEVFSVGDEVGGIVGMITGGGAVGSGEGVVGIGTGAEVVGRAKDKRGTT